MFICKPCWIDRAGLEWEWNWELALHSRGGCELCQKGAICADIHHSKIPLPKEEVTVSEGFVEYVAYDALKKHRDNLRSDLNHLRESCFALRLEWFCDYCEWSTRIDVPGFAGDGYYHYIDGNPENPCGPLLARRVPSVNGGKS